MSARDIGDHGKEGAPLVEAAMSRAWTIYVCPTCERSYLDPWRGGCNGTHSGNSHEWVECEAVPVVPAPVVPWQDYLDCPLCAASKGEPCQSIRFGGDRAEPHFYRSHVDDQAVRVEP